MPRAFSRGMRKGNVRVKDVGLAVRANANLVMLSTHISMVNASSLRTGPAGLVMVLGVVVAPTTSRTTSCVRAPVAHKRIPLVIFRKVLKAGRPWPEAAATFKISEVAPYMLRANLGAVNSKTVTVNKDYWDGLPEEVKIALQAVAIEYRDHLAGIAMDRAAAAEAKYTETGGTIVDVSAEDRAAWANAMPNIAVEWAENLNGKGEQGTEMLGAYLGKLEAAGFVGVRDWTKP